MKTQVEITRNVEKKGIELKFPSVPSAAILEKLHEWNFKWNKYTKVWYKTYSEPLEKQIRDYFEQEVSNAENPTTESSQSEVSRKSVVSSLKAEPNALILKSRKIFKNNHYFDMILNDANENEEIKHDYSVSDWSDGRDWKHEFVTKRRLIEFSKSWDKGYLSFNGDGNKFELIEEGGKYSYYPEGVHFKTSTLKFQLLEDVKSKSLIEENFYVPIAKEAKSGSIEYADKEPNGFGSKERYNVGDRVENLNFGLIFHGIVKLEDENKWYYNNEPIVDYHYNVQLDNGIELKRQSVDMLRPEKEKEEFVVPAIKTINTDQYSGVEGAVIYDFPYHVWNTLIKHVKDYQYDKKKSLKASVNKRGWEKAMDKYDNYIKLLRADWHYWELDNIKAARQVTGETQEEQDERINIWTKIVGDKNDYDVIIKQKEEQKEIKSELSSQSAFREKYGKHKGETITYPKGAKIYLFAAYWIAKKRLTDSDKDTGVYELVYNYLRKPKYSEIRIGLYDAIMYVKKSFVSVEELVDAIKKWLRENTDAYQVESISDVLDYLKQHGQITEEVYANSYEKLVTNRPQKPKKGDWVHRVFIIHKDNTPATEFENLTEEQAGEKYYTYWKDANSEITTWDRNKYDDNYHVIEHQNVEMFINKTEEKPKPIATTIQKRASEIKVGDVIKAGTGYKYNIVVEHDWKNKNNFATILQFWNYGFGEGTLGRVKESKLDFPTFDNYLGNLDKKTGITTYNIVDRAEIMPFIERLSWSEYDFFVDNGFKQTLIDKYEDYYPEIKYIYEKIYGKDLIVGDWVGIKEDDWKQTGRLDKPHKITKEYAKNSGLYMLDDSGKYWSSGELVKITHPEDVESEVTISDIEFAEAEMELMQMEIDIANSKKEKEKSQVKTGLEGQILDSVTGKALNIGDVVKVGDSEDTYQIILSGGTPYYIAFDIDENKIVGHTKYPISNNKFTKVLNFSETDGGFMFEKGGILTSLSSTEAIQASNPFAIRKKIQFAKDHPEVFMLKDGGDLTPAEKANQFQHFMRKLAEISRFPKNLNVLKFAEKVGLSNDANDVILKALIRNRVPFIIIDENWLETQRLYDSNEIKKELVHAVFFNQYGLGRNKNTNTVFCSTMASSIKGLINYAVMLRTSVEQQYQEGFVHECIHAYLHTVGFDHMTKKREDMLKLNSHILNYLRKNPKEVDTNRAAYIFAKVVDATGTKSSVDELITWSYTTPKMKEFFDKIVLSDGVSVMQHIRNIVNSFDSEKALESYFKNKYEGSAISQKDIQDVELEMLKMENEIFKSKIAQKS